MILSTKLQIPRVKGNILERERCTRMLQENTDQKLILINAGAGYGKTTLLSQFMAQTDLPCVFYHLEPGDSELAIFFSYLDAGFRRISPRFGRRMKTVLRMAAPATEHTDMIVGTFINEFVENATGDTIIVLDDYHNIDPSRQIDEALDYLLCHAPQNLHLIIATRQRPVFAMTRLKTHNELMEMTHHDLKFNRREIDQLFRRTHGISLDRHELRALEEHSEGWVTSLQLVLQTTGKDLSDRLRSHIPLPQQKIPGKWWSTYFNYFAQEIYEREPPEVQDFMVSISILEWLDHDVCNKITGRRNSGEILRYLEQKNAFVSSMPDGNYRFHNLFRDFLLSKWPDMESKKRTSLSAADHFRKKGQTAMAIPYYLEAGQHIRAARLIRETGDEMTNSGKSRTVVSYIEKLPPGAVQFDPALLMVYSYAQMSSGHPNGAIANLTKAIRLLKKQGDRSRKLAQAYYDLGSIYFNLGNLKTAKRWLIEALRTSPTKRALSNAAMLNSQGLIYSKAGGAKLKEAAGCFGQASGIVRRFPENNGLEVSIMNNWAMTDRKAGDLHTAYRKIVDAVHLLREEANFSPHFGTIFGNAVRLCVSTGNTTKVASILKLGLELSNKYNDTCSLAAIWCGYAAFYEELGDLNMSVEYLRKAVQVFERLHLNRMTSIVHKDLCRIYTKLGDLAKADESIADIRRLRKPGDDVDAVSIHIVEARLRLAQHKMFEAENLLADAVRLAKRYTMKYELFLALLERARLMHMNRRGTEVLKYLTRAARLSEDNAYDYSLSKFIKEHGWAIGSLMKVAETYTSTIIKHRKIAYHSVEVYLFGTPRVVVDGRTIEDRAWKTSKALKLFCYMCSRQHTMIPRDILIDALWKDASASSGARNLRKAMHHIRQALGTVIPHDESPVIYRNKKYQLAPDLSVWLDIAEFEDLMKRSKTRQDDREQCIAEAITLYQDGYAKGWYDDWVEAMRGYYARQYGEGIAALADVALRRRHFRECAALCQKLVAHDPYDETYRRKLWGALAELKRFNDVKKDFAELKRLLKQDLQTEPQRQTVDYYNRIVK
ncbi:hypothetical protein IBX73_10535 [candidate division WOR-3 bacterium]|nr:hypothetical protein [candidate division WOR-3 bacterium]